MWEIVVDLALMHFLILVSLVLFFSVSFASNYNSDPKIFVEELVNDAINLLSDKNTTKEEKKNSIEIIALENVDIDALGLYTLGELRKSTDEKKLEKYQEAFKKYFLKSLTSRLTDYSSNKFGETSSWIIVRWFFIIRNSK